MAKRRPVRGNVGPVGGVGGSGKGKVVPPLGGRVPSLGAGHDFPSDGSAGSPKNTLGSALTDALGFLFGYGKPGSALTDPKAVGGASKSGGVGKGGLVGASAGTPGVRIPLGGGKPARTGAAQNTKQVEQQNRADKKYGKGKYVAGTDGKLRPVRSGGGGGGGGHSHGGGGKAAPGKAAPAAPKTDEIADMLAGMLSQSERLTGFYNTQLKGIGDQTVKDGLALSAAQGSLGTMAPTVYYGGDAGVAQQAKQYTDLVNAAAQADTKARLAASQSGLAGTSNAQQSYYNALRDNANMRHVEYARSLRAMEPKLRRDKAAAEADAALKQAEQKYLYDKLGVDASYKQGQLDLGNARLNETIRNNNLLDTSRRASLQLSLADKNVKNALAGSKISGAERREINAWVKDHLYMKNTVEEMKDGMPTGNTTSVWSPKPLQGDSAQQLGGIIKQMIAAGFSPEASVRVAQEHARGSAAKIGAGRFFATLVNAGVSPRQSIAQVARVFGSKAANKVKRNKNEYLGVQPKFDEVVGNISDALPGGK